MSDRGFYQLDPEAETVEVRVVGLDRDAAAGLQRWLRDTVRWMDAQQVARDGGRRWEFDRPVGGETEGRKMVGKVGRKVPLVRTSVRQPRPCSACRGPVEGPCWRQKPHAGLGYARLRFCTRCVEGSPATPPRLRVITGGTRP